MKVDVAQRRSALNHAVRQYYIQSAEHALRYAPFPSSAALGANANGAEVQHNELEFQNDA